MKRFVFPCVIILGLIIFFAVTCFKDSFNRNDKLKAESFFNSKERTINQSTVSSRVSVTEDAEFEKQYNYRNEQIIGHVEADSDTYKKASNETTFFPSAVPVITKEEAIALNESILEGEENEEVFDPGIVFYDERFLFAQDVQSKANIQQTNNWKYVPGDSDSDSVSLAQKQDFFVVKSETPLEFAFAEHLLEQTMYCYTLCCSVRGEGKVFLSQKDEEKTKEFSINTQKFETLVYKLGGGYSFNAIIIPTIAFQGNLQIESITLYQKRIDEQRTVCLGTIENISNVPDIEQSNYPDCFYTAKFVVEEILDGKPVPHNIQLLIPAFLNNKIDPLSKVVKKGDWMISIRPFSLATQEEQEIEQVDEIETYLFTPYILVAAAPKKNSEHITTSGIPILEGEAYVSPFDNPVNPPLPSKFADDSKKEIEKELALVNRIIEQVNDKTSINEDFLSAWNEKQKKYDSLNPSMIWAKENGSFFALPKKWKLLSSSQIAEENVAALVELNRLFYSQGIQFIIQIVPDYRDIAALVLNPEFQKYGDQRSARAAKQCLEHGIEIQYLSDEVIKKAFDYERLFFYPNDYHPDEGMVDVMTSVMAQRLEKFGDDILPKDLDSSLFTKESRDTGYKNNLKWPENVNIGSHDAGSPVQVPYVLYNRQILESNPESKVLVFGNSFTQEPMTKNAYISYLAPKILHSCSCRSISGISTLTTLPQLFLTSPEKYLKGKRVAILPVSVTFLTDDRYRFSNVSHVDAFLKKQNKSEFIVDLPLKQIDTPVFSPAFVFDHIFLPDYLPFHTSSIDLSKDRKQITLSIPPDVMANTVRISVQPLYGYGVSLKVNGVSTRIPSNHYPKWELLEIDLDKSRKDITIEIDFENCSSLEAKVLIGSVSLFR